MGRINITEKTTNDFQTNRSIDVVVLILGYHKTSPGISTTNYSPKVYSKVSDFTIDYPETDENDNSLIRISEAVDSDVEDAGVISYRYAKGLLNSGVKIIFHNIYDPSKLTVSSIINFGANEDGYSNYKLSIYENKRIYNITVATTAGFACGNKPNTVASLLNQLANVRKDIINIFDVESTVDSNSVVGSFTRDTYSSGSSAYAPWCYMTDYDDHDLMPASYPVLLTLASNIASGLPEWYSFAGVARGKLPRVRETQYEVSDTLEETWISNGINPIVKIDPYGYVIFGNKTLYSDSNSQLSSLNVRMVANSIKKVIFESCLSLSYEPNGLLLWNSFRAKVGSYLDKVQYNNGIYRYQIIMDDRNNQPGSQTVTGLVRVWITRLAESFDIDVELANSETDLIS